MQRSRIALIAAAAMLAGCTTFGARLPVPGEPETVVLAQLGRPTHVFHSGDTRLLEYTSAPFGQTTYFATIGRDGKLISYEQVLKAKRFAQIVIGQSSKTDVLHLIGTPGDTSYLDLPQLEVWSYAYWENPVSDSIMHVHFDHSGIVRKMVNAPDLRRDGDHGL